MRLFLWIVGGVVAAFILLVIIGTLMMPHTYGQMAQQEARDCRLNKGYGHWVGSSGMTLDDFCDGVGKLRALEAARREHPEQF